MPGPPGPDKAFKSFSNTQGSDKAFKTLPPAISRPIVRLISSPKQSGNDRTFELFFRFFKTKIHVCTLFRALQGVIQQSDSVYVVKKELKKKFVQKNFKTIIIKREDKTSYKNKKYDLKKKKKCRIEKKKKEGKGGK